jgi:protein-L-isoaspartate(D-aspartate) O-methyltransferase
MRSLKIRNTHMRLADGGMGWPEQGPFDGILVTAAPPEVPQELLDQLADGGVMVVPLGEGTQMLTQIVRQGNGFETTEIAPVRFVPLLGGVVR